MRRLVIVVPVLAAALAACSGMGSTEVVSTNPNPAPDVINAVLTAPQKQAVTLDLTTAAGNFDNALAAGLPLTDEDACIHIINQQLGIEAVAGGTSPYATFDMTNNGVVSLGSEIYVDAMKAAAFKQGGIVIPANCLAVWGKINLMMASQVITGVGGVPITVGAPASGPALQKLVRRQAVSQPSK